MVWFDSKLRNDFIFRDDDFSIISCFHFYAFLHLTVETKAKFSTWSLFSTSPRVSLSFLCLYFFLFFWFALNFTESKPNLSGKNAVECCHGIDDFFRFHFQFPSCDENIKYNHVMKLFPFHHLNFQQRSFASAMRKLFCFGVYSCLFNLLLQWRYSSFWQKYRAFFLHTD